MPTVEITINGRPVRANEGSTILEAAKTAGIEIPTLCHHPALSDIGACRLCVVEVSGQREAQPACTFPVRAGIDVRTESQKVVEIRKFVLDMLFSERSHFCMYCEMSGDCELQSLAYKYGLDRSAYPIPSTRLPVDASRKHFLMDHNRCILCRRCIRACGELVGNNTLGVKMRGSRNMISADLDQPFGESSCVACGTCLQVCPTGALVDYHSVYGGRGGRIHRTKSACMECGVGCATEVVSRDDRVLRVEGDWDGSNRGVLCSAGRFEWLEDDRDRVKTPMIRFRGVLVPAGWDEALDRVAERIKGASGSIAAWTSGRALNETLDEFSRLFRGKLGARVGAIGGKFADPALPSNGMLGHIDHADVILIAGGNPLENHPVIGYRVRQAQRRGARLAIVPNGTDPSVGFPRRNIERVSLEKAIEACDGGEHPVVVIGSGIGVEEARKLTILRGRARFLLLHSTPNGAYLRQLGITDGADAGEKELLYLLLEDDRQDKPVSTLTARFIVVHASVFGEATERADIVLPAPLWYERQGTFTNMEGLPSHLRRSVPPPEGILPEVEVLSLLAARL